MQFNLREYLTNYLLLEITLSSLFLFKCLLHSFSYLIFYVLHTCISSYSIKYLRVSTYHIKVRKLTSTNATCHMIGLTSLLISFIFFKTLFFTNTVFFEAFLFICFNHSLDHIKIFFQPL